MVHKNISERISDWLASLQRTGQRSQPDSRILVCRMNSTNKWYVIHETPHTSEILSDYQCNEYDKARNEGRRAAKELGLRMNIHVVGTTP